MDAVLLCITCPSHRGGDASGHRAPARRQDASLEPDKDVWEPDEVMRHHRTDRIFMGRGLPKIALGIPDGANRSVSEAQREMLLVDKVAPYQRRVKWFAEGVFGPSSAGGRTTCSMPTV